jgi:hypothetical protein
VTRHCFVPPYLLRQIALFAAAYYAYRLTRGAIDDPQGAAVAFGNARNLIHVEQSLGLFVEPSVQAWSSAASDHSEKSTAHITWLNAAPAVN